MGFAGAAREAKWGICGGLQGEVWCGDAGQRAAGTGARWSAAARERPAGGVTAGRAGGWAASRPRARA